MSFYSTYVAKRAEKVSTKRVKFSLCLAIVFILIGTMGIVDAKTNKELIIGVAIVCIFAWTALIASLILIFKNQAS